MLVEIVFYEKRHENYLCLSYYLCFIGIYESVCINLCGELQYYTAKYLLKISLTTLIGTFE